MTKKTKTSPLYRHMPRKRPPRSGILGQLLAKAVNEVEDEEEEDLFVKVSLTMLVYI